MGHSDVGHGKWWWWGGEGGEGLVRMAIKVKGVGGLMRASRVEGTL